MTAVECLKQDIDRELKHGTKMIVNWDMYLEMEKQQIIDTYIDIKKEYINIMDCYPPKFVVDGAEQYYNETFKNK